MAIAATDGELSDVEHRAELRKAVVAATVGTTIEWYDFFIYGTAAGLIFPKLFFPNEDPLTGTLAAFASSTAERICHRNGRRAVSTKSTGPRYELLTQPRAITDRVNLRHRLLMTPIQPPPMAGTVGHTSGPCRPAPRIALYYVQEQPSQG